MSDTNLLILLVGFAVVWFGIAVLYRLPRYRSAGFWNYESRPSDGTDVSIWFNVDQCGGFEFEAGLADQNVSQMSFYIAGDAKCSDTLPEIKRASVTIISDIRATKRETNIIGRGETYLSGATLRIFLSPNDASNLLRIFTANLSHDVHLMGFKTPSGELKIDYFTVKQTVESVDFP